MIAANKEIQGTQIPYWEKNGPPVPVVQSFLRFDFGLEGVRQTGILYPAAEADYARPCFMVVGPQGSGKSSLIRRLGGKNSADSGNKPSVLDWLLGRRTGNTVIKKGPRARTFGEQTGVPCTTDIEVFQTNLPNYFGQKTMLHLIDMPGFNETSLRGDKDNWMSAITYLMLCYGDNFKGFICVISDESHPDRNDIAMIAALCECGMTHEARALITFYTCKGNPDIQEVNNLDGKFLQNLRNKGLNESRTHFNPATVTNVNDAFRKDSMPLDTIKDTLTRLALDPQCKNRPCIWKVQKWIEASGRKGVNAKNEVDLEDFFEEACKEGVKIDQKKWREKLGGSTGNGPPLRGPIPGLHRSS